ncbi:hypothetical protein T5B8_06798 [Salinisphaera sp. T5B8]|uniref:DUF3465 domain-containing protein n=1 Tax=Salinisphaera sp. T5B8 TaxID=1304154 RepID=UPI0033407157
MKRLLFTIAVAVALIAGGEQLLPDAPRGATATPERAQTRSDAIARAFAQHARDVPVTGEGRVKTVLADDERGSRHQRFILELASGQTLLIAHNIDIAPRIAHLAAGDRVRFHGIYEYNPQGGVVHWTHHDPQGRHAGGWLEYDGRRYE